MIKKDHLGREVTYYNGSITIDENDKFKVNLSDVFTFNSNGKIESKYDKALKLEKDKLEINLNPYKGLQYDVDAKN